MISILRKYPGIASASLVAFLLLALFWPILFGAHVLVGNWTIFDQYPRLIALSNSLKAGESTLWYNNYLGGFPIYLGVWGEYVNPVSLFFYKTFNAIDVSHWTMLLNALLGALFIFWFSRELKLSALAGTMAALVYTFSEWNLQYGTMLFWSNVYPLIPLIFLSVFKIFQGKWRYGFLLIAVTAYGWYMAMPDVFLFTLLGAIGFSLFLDWKKTTLIVLLCLGFGTALAAPKLVSDYAFVSLSTRSEGVRQAQGFLESAESNGYIGPNSLIDMLYPYFSIPFANFIPFFNGADKLTFLYIGISPLILLALFWLNSKKLWREKSPILYLAGMFLVTLIMLIKYVPLFYLVHKLPIFNLFGGTGKYSFLMYFALPIIIGYALDNLEEIKSHPWWKGATGLLFWFFSGITACLVVANIVFTVFRNQLINLGFHYFETHLYKQASTGKPLAHYVTLISNTYDTAFHSISLGNIEVVASFSFVALGALLLYWYRNNLRPTKIVQLLFILFTVFNIMIVEQGMLGVAPRSFLTATNPSTTFLEKNIDSSNPYRVFRLWAGLGEYANLGFDQSKPGEQNQLETENFLYNYAMLHNIPYLGGHENLLSARQAKLLTLVGSERAGGQNTWVLDQKTPITEKVSRFSSAQNTRLLELLNVKYVLTAFPFTNSWKKVYTGTTAEGSTPLLVYQLPTPSPRVYFAEKTVFVPNEEPAAFAALLATSTAPGTAVIECTEPTCQETGTVPDKNDSVKVDSIQSGHLIVTTHNKTPRWLVFSESNLPTWEITITDTATGASVQGTIRQANYLFQGILVPAGDHTVVFNYPGLLTQFSYAAKKVSGKLLGQ